MSSFDEIQNILPERIDAPADKGLIEKLSNAFRDFDSIFKKMEAANVPTLHLVIVSYTKIVKFIEKWPMKLEKLKQNIKQCNYI